MQHFVVHEEQDLRVQHLPFGPTSRARTRVPYHIISHGIFEPEGRAIEDRTMKGHDAGRKIEDRAMKGRMTQGV